MIELINLLLWTEQLVFTFLRDSTIDLPANIDWER